MSTSSSGGGLLAALKKKKLKKGKKKEQKSKPKATGRGALLDAIRGGVKLKKKGNKKKVKSSGGGRGDLLSAIKNGPKLRKAGTRPKGRSFGAKPMSLQEQMKARLSGMRKTRVGSSPAKPFSSELGLKKKRFGNDRSAEKPKSPSWMNKLRKSKSQRDLDIKSDTSDVKEPSARFTRKKKVPTTSSSLSPQEQEKQRKIDKLRRQIAKGGIRARAAKSELAELLKEDETARTKRQIAEKLAKKKADKKAKAEARARAAAEKKAQEDAVAAEKKRKREERIARKNKMAARAAMFLK
eukprot:CAMPEP_0167755572 /NCGR_PEP_ID=MMETSP0110_2-20121227/8904_1 /TAXON_ID=629695 /ORGANISM="Gymnochlora sp., Strain CCMP2014" /LENGTH=295 /DNA_ID=CAMNT_0007641585 /DNA_START=177 /DNA_END=1064 /DNA_ORIENTATION=-